MLRVTLCVNARQPRNKGEKLEALPFLGLNINVIKQNRFLNPVWLTVLSSLTGVTKILHVSLLNACYAIVSGCDTIVHVSHIPGISL